MSWLAVTGEIDVLTAQSHLALKVAHDDEWPFVTGRMVGVGCITHVDDHRVIQHVTATLWSILQALCHLRDETKKPVADFLVMRHALGIALVSAHMTVGMVTQVDTDTQVGLGIDLGRRCSDCGNIAKPTDE